MASSCVWRHSPQQPNPPHRRMKADNTDFSDVTLRTIAHTESDDLIHWTRPIVTMNRDRFDGTHQIGEITRIPYESMWIGLLGVYHWPEGM